MNQQKLSDAGINWESGVKRFSGKTALYEKYLLKFPADADYRDMMTALEQKDYEAAFRCAHTLKGVAGNLSLDKLYERIVPLVEALRGGQLSEIDLLAEQVTESYRSTVAAIE